MDRLIFDKAYRVIKSCNTQAHMDTAFHFIRLASINKYIGFTQYNALLFYFSGKSDGMKIQ